MKPQPRMPNPAEQPRPDSGPGPTLERPKRKRIALPVFSTHMLQEVQHARLAFAGITLAIGLGLHAQNVPTPTTNPTGEGTTPTPQRGWVMFDDGVGSELRMPPEQLQQLRGVDERYLNDYRALGTDPASDPRYMELTERRNAEVRHLMGESLYTTWSSRYQPVPNTIQEQRSGGISTPLPPTP